MNCQYCNQKLNPTSKFCPVCGKKVKVIIPRSEKKLRKGRTINFTQHIYSLVSRINIPLANFYKLYSNFFNYTLIAGIGFLINEFVVHLFFPNVGLAIAVLFGVLTSMIWNYTNMVGIFSVNWGFKGKSNQSTETVNRTGEKMKTFCRHCGKNLEEE